MAFLKPEDVDYLILHCSAGSTKSIAADLRAYHMKPVSDGGRGWSDIGYHFVVKYYGNTYSDIVEEGRPTTTMGAQAQGFNARSLGICMVGNFDKIDPSQLQYAATVELIAALAIKYEVAVENILGHRETYDALGQRRMKTCPGTRVDLDKFRSDVAARIGGGNSLLV